MKRERPMDMPQKSHRNRRAKTLVNLDRRDLKDVELIQGDVMGKVIRNQFYVARLIDQGSFGKVYKCINLNSSKQPLVIKVSEDIEIFKKEISAMKNIYQVYSKNFNLQNQPSPIPEVILHGSLI